MRKYIKFLSNKFDYDIYDDDLSEDNKYLTIRISSYPTNKDKIEKPLTFEEPVFFFLYIVVKFDLA